MGKLLKWALSLISIGAIGVYFSFWVTYFLSIKEANEIGRQMVCQEQLNEEYEGEISSITRYEYDDYMNTRFFALNITTFDTNLNSISYQFVKKDNRDLLSLVQVGQKVKKAKGESKFMLMSGQGESREIEIPGCRK